MNDTIMQPEQPSNNGLHPHIIEFMSACKDMLTRMEQMTKEVTDPKQKGE